MNTEHDTAGGWGFVNRYKLLLIPAVLLVLALVGVLVLGGGESDAPLLYSVF